MERSAIDQIREAHASMYAEMGDHERAKEIATAEDKYVPLFKTREVHPEEEPSLNEINLIFKDIGNDLYIINAELAKAGEKYKNLIDDMKLRLEKVKRDIAIEEERLLDLNMLCGDHSDFDAAETLTADDFTGEFSEEDGVFTAKIIDETPVRLEVLDVKGNGYEGNSFVIKDNRFISETMDTSNRNNMVDNYLSTAYEYSRINADQSENTRFAFINFDGIEAECSITLKASSPVSTIRIQSDMDNLMLKEVSISDDGSVFRPVIEENILFNQVERRYRHGDYIYGTGIISFPLSQYIKITLRSNGHTNEQIAYEFFEASEV